MRRTREPGVPRRPADDLFVIAGARVSASAPTRLPMFNAVRAGAVIAFGVDGHATRNAKRGVVAYDVHLADRVRELLVDYSPLTEQLMFGGLAFLVAGKLAVAPSSQGGLLVRVDPADADVLLATANARAMEMKGRVIRGWLYVDGDDLRTRSQLAQWIAIGTAAAKNAKRAKR